MRGENNVTAILFNMLNLLATSEDNIVFELLYILSRVYTSQVTFLIHLTILYQMYSLCDTDGRMVGHKIEENGDVSWALFEGVNYFLKGLEQKYKSTVKIPTFQAETDLIILHSSQLCVTFQESTENSTRNSSETVL